ncbi:DUF1254 domain-containing protein [Nocardia lasii]|uniref:DUF1254 domain-containing protein n=1 Tax=Nocardia lasii TaxID=1616107 RepID=A0ABW1JRC4_9NOCA
MTTKPSDTATAIALLAADAYVYGYPPLFDLAEVRRLLTNSAGMLPTAPFNEFSNATALATPETKFVSVNNDTIYSVANIDTSGGPVRFDVPDAGDRYYVMQFVDVWTNNFAYVGRRATGTGAGSYLLVAPDWEGKAPKGTTVIRFPTTVGTIVGRWAVDGEDDLAEVAKLQAGLRLTPTGPGVGLPAPTPGVGDELAFFERLRVLVRAFPPAQRDQEFQQRFAPLGLFAEECPYLNPDPTVAALLRRGLELGKQAVEKAAGQVAKAEQNGWQLTYHMFDYNIDFFEVGTIDSPEWKLPDTPARYLERATTARGALWGNHGYEACYPTTFVDTDGNALDGAHSYELRFDSPPPCDAFWSITMYDRPNYFLVDNPIGRYSIGDRTPGLKTGKDGSLTITIQHEEPTDATRRANWLPAPAGPFRPMLRVYQPQKSLLDGSYVLPGITRIEDKKPAGKRAKG